VKRNRSRDNKRRRRVLIPAGRAAVSARFGRYPRSRLGCSSTRSSKFQHHPEQWSKHPRTGSSIWHVTSGDHDRSEFEAQTEARSDSTKYQPRRFHCAPRITRTREVMLLSGALEMGSVDRYFARLIELRRRSVQSKETLGRLLPCARVPCKQEARRIAFRACKKYSPAGVTYFLSRLPGCRSCLRASLTAYMSSARRQRRRGRDLEENRTGSRKKKERGKERGGRNEIGKPETRRCNQIGDSRRLYPNK